MEANGVVWHGTQTGVEYFVAHPTKLHLENKVEGMLSYYDETDHPIFKSLVNDIVL